MVVLLKFPRALRRCGIGIHTQKMFMDAVLALKGLKAKAVFPVERIRAIQTTDSVTKVVKAWKNWDFPLFGKELGMLLQRLVIVTFPQKYSIDGAGTLRRELSGRYGHDFGTLRGLLLGRRSNPLFAIIVAGCALSVFVALVAVRSMWLTGSSSDNGAAFASTEEDCHVWELE